MHVFLLAHFMGLYFECFSIVLDNYEAYKKKTTSESHLNSLEI